MNLVRATLMNDRTNTAITESMSWSCPFCGTSYSMSYIDWKHVINDFVTNNRGMLKEFPFCSKRCKFLDRLKGRDV